MVEDTVVTQKIAEVAADIGARMAELTTEFISLYERELPHLVHDDERVVSLLAASLQQNLDTGLRIFQHGIDPNLAEAPAAALEYARRLAQRGTPVIDLVRAYQVAQIAMLDQAMATCATHTDDAELLDIVGRRAMHVTHTVVYRVTQQVVSAYEEERDRWQLNRNAVRAARVRSLLDGNRVDIDESENALGYRLRGTHLGVVAWHADPHTTDGLGTLERLTTEVAKRLDLAGRPLFVPCDESSAWVWLPVAGEPPAPRRIVEAGEEAHESGDPEILLAFGAPCADVAGFRRTHRQALRVQALRVMTGGDGERVMTFGEVGAVALMAADLEATSSWVADTLGELAADGKAARRLRETLRVFLATGSSYTAAAAQLMMHKNSVQYRVHKAEELLGRPVADNRLDVELALALCHWLGSVVLTHEKS